MRNTISTCEHCGSELEPIVIMGHEVASKPCMCPKAQEECRQREAEEARRREQERLAELKRRYELAGIKPRFIGADAECGRYVDMVGDGRGLYIYGPVGAGKTRLAASISKAFIDSGTGVRFLTSLQALGSIRETFGTGLSEDEAVRKLCEVPVLVLDDLGKEPPSDWAVATLFRVINERYDCLRPTIVTTQYGSSDLVKRLAREGDESAVAIVSRLREMCDGVRLEGADRRLQREAS